MNKIKRERCPNWDSEEKEIFFHCLNKSKSIIEDSRKDFNTNLKKHEAWQNIANDFNSYGKVQKVIK